MLCLMSAPLLSTLSSPWPDKLQGLQHGTKIQLTDGHQILVCVQLELFQACLRLLLPLIQLRNQSNRYLQSASLSLALSPSTHGPDGFESSGMPSSQYSLSSPQAESSLILPWTS